jgi:type II secretion system protein N
MKDKIQKFLPWLLLPPFYGLCLVLFTFFTFPFDKLKDKIVTSFNAQQKSGTMELSIEEMNSHFVTGVKAKGIKLTTAGDPGKPPVEVKIDEAKARVSVLGLLVGHRDVTYSFLLGGGEVSGSYEEHGKDRAIDVNIDGVDIGQVEIITSQLGVPMEGKLTGQVKFALPEGKAGKATGLVNLGIAGVTIGDGKAKLKGMLALPKLDIGEITIAAEAKEGQLKVTKINAGGKDVELQGDGRVTLRDLAPDALLDLNLKFKVNDGYRSKNDQTKSIFGAPGSKMPALFEMDPKVSRAKRPDGFYAFHARGTLGRPVFDPAGTPGLPGGSGSGGMGLVKDGPGVFVPGRATDQ